MRLLKIGETTYNLDMVVRFEEGTVPVDREAETIDAPGTAIHGMKTGPAPAPESVPFVRVWFVGDDKPRHLRGDQMRAFLDGVGG